MSYKRASSKNPAIPIKKIFVLLSALSLVLMLSACAFMPKEEEVLAPPLKEPPKVSYDTQDVKKGTIQRDIIGTGYFVSVIQHDIAFKERSGYLKVLNVKTGDKVKAGDLIAELDSDNLVSQLKQQELNIKKAELEYDKVKTKIDIEGGGDLFGLQKAALDVEICKTQLESLKRDIEKSKLYASVSGMVVFTDSTIALGDNIAINKLLARIADPSQIQLQFSDQNKISDFNIGMNVNIKYRNKMYSGMAVMTPSSAPIDADEKTRKSVMIRMNELPDDVEVGNSADISLTLEKRENTLVIPKNAVGYYNGRKYVQILEDGIRKERDIETGIETVTEVEVIKGLKEGDKLILR